MRSVDPGSRRGAVKAKRRSIHDQSLGIFHSQSRSSEGPHPPLTLGWRKKVTEDEMKGMGNDRPEEDIESIPEDDWETDCGPDGNPGVCL